MLLGVSFLVKEALTYLIEYNIAHNNCREILCYSNTVVNIQGNGFNSSKFYFLLYFSSILRVLYCMHCIVLFAYSTWPSPLNA